MDLVLVIATWLHTLAMLILLGYYGTLGRFVVPALRDAADRSGAVATLVTIERRARWFLVLAAGLFIVTGAYLLVVDDQYAGLGNVTGSTWAGLMLVKHLVVAGVLAAGVVLDLVVDDLRRGADEGDDRRLTRIGRLAELATGLGAVAILLTAIAQAG